MLKRLRDYKQTNWLYIFVLNQEIVVRVQGLTVRSVKWLFKMQDQDEQMQAKDLFVKSMRSKHRSEVKSESKNRIKITKSHRQAQSKSSLEFVAKQVLGRIIFDCSRGPHTLLID